MSSEMSFKSFDDDALGFLISYARRTRGQPFCSEDVTLAALEAGIAPKDLRSWGNVFVQAKKDGYIRRANTAFPRSMGNRTLTLGWVAA